MFLLFLVKGCHARPSRTVTSFCRIWALSTIHGARIDPDYSLGELGADSGAISFQFSTPYKTFCGIFPFHR